MKLFMNIFVFRNEIVRPNRMHNQWERLECQKSKVESREVSNYRSPNSICKAISTDLYLQYRYEILMTSALTNMGIIIGIEHKVES